MDEPDGAQSKTVQGNTTVDPLSQAVAVDTPAIKDVLDCDTGDYRDVRQWIGSWRYELLVPQRLDIKERIGTAPRFRCSLCSVASTAPSVVSAPAGRCSWKPSGMRRAPIPRASSPIRLPHWWMPSARPASPRPAATSSRAIFSPSLGSRRRRMPHGRRAGSMRGVGARVSIHAKR